MIIVPDVKGWRDMILQEFHAGVSGEHSGYLRTYKRVAFNFMWPEMKGAVKKFVAECDVCQRNYYESISSPGLLQPLSIPEGGWTDISMDFIEGLPNARGKTVLWVIID